VEFTSVRYLASAPKALVHSFYFVSAVSFYLSQVQLFLFSNVLHPTTHYIIATVNIAIMSSGDVTPCSLVNK
jgi:hypothetical protein